jgi:feruloyl-CoA synthase
MAPSATDGRFLPAKSLAMASRSESFAAPSVEHERRADGSHLLRSTTRLGAFPASIGSMLAWWAAERPGRTFLAERDGDGWRTATYAEMFEAVRRIASGLLAMGLTRATPVAILSENSLAHASLSLAALYAGIPVAPISPAYSTQYGDLRRLRFVLDALHPRMVFADDADRYRDALDAVDPAATIVSDRGIVGRTGALTLSDLLATGIAPDLDEQHHAVASDDVAKILFTSGSTGEPKGVVNTHRMLCSNQQSLAQLWPFLTAHDLVLVDWLPWHHTFGGNHNFNMVLAHGGTLYIDDGKPLPGRFERSVLALEEHPPTVYFNVPRGHRLLVDALTAHPPFATQFFSQLRLIGNAAAALPHPTWNALRELARQYGSGDVAVTGSWGLTETAPMATAVHYALRDPADIGLPGPGTELLFVPFENKLEIRVRGPLVTPGYWRRDDLTAAAFDDEGFYRTGDAVRFADPADPAQGLRFDGRIAENFKLGSGSWVDAGAVRLAVLAETGALVDEVVVAGETRDEIGLLLFVGSRARSEFDDDDALRAAVATLVARYNAAAGGSSQRAACALLAFDQLSPADGEITDKGSVNQRRVLDRRAAEIERMFADPPPEDAIVMRQRSPAPGAVPPPERTRRRS